MKKSKELHTNGNITPGQIKPEQLSPEQLKLQKQADKIASDIADKLGFDKLPTDMTISTMTLSCKVNTQFNCKNIARYVDLSYGGILSVKCGSDDNTKTNRTLLPKKQKTGKPKKKKSVFYNQVSMYVMVKGKNKKPVSVKLFLNGAIQMTGCKTIAHAIEALSKIFIELRKIKAIITSKHYCLRVVEQNFVTNRDVLNVKHVKNISVAMINSNFSINFKIDRAKLHNLMLVEGYEVSYDPEKHACVNIKYDHTDKQLSIFVFEGGSIIITGVRNCYQILDAYNFINKYLLTNYNKIIKNNNVTNSNIIKFLDKENLRENIHEDFLSDSDDHSASDSSDDENFDFDELDVIEDIDEIEDILSNLEDIELTEAGNYMSEIYKYTDSDNTSDKNNESDDEHLQKKSKVKTKTARIETPDKKNTKR